MTSRRRVATRASTGSAPPPVAAAAPRPPLPEDLERSLATRPRRKLTPEEKVERRRLQYKLHQRRHRAKQQERTVELELEVCQLAESVATLNDERRKMLQSQRVFHSRGTLVGAPARVTSEYLRHFAHGYAASRGDEQEQFLRFIMLPNVAGPDYEGIEQLMEQSRLYSQFFARTVCTPSVVQVSPIGELTSVVVECVLTVYPQRDGVLCLYPNLRGSEEIIQALVRSAIHVPGKLRFVFDGSGACSWFGTDLDFVAGLQRTLGCLKKVSACVQDANISFSTGQISPASRQLAQAEVAPVLEAFI